MDLNLGLGVLSILSDARAHYLGQRSQFGVEGSVYILWERGLPLLAMSSSADRFLRATAASLYDQNFL